MWLVLSSAAWAQNARIVLRWKEVPGASAYELQIAKDAAFVEVVLQTRTSTAGYRWEQLPTTTHWWRVRSVDADNRLSEWSPPRTIAVDSAVPTPLKPAEGAAVVCGASVVLELAPSTLIKEYQVELSATADFATPRLLKSATPTFEVPGLSAGSWYWRSRAIDVRDTRTGAGPVRSFTVRVPPPRLKPAADATLPAQVNLTWGAVGCAASYVVEASHDGHDRVSLPASTTQLSFKASAAGDYRWRVASVDEKGTAGEWSAESVFRVRLAAPRLKAEVVGERAELSWSPVAGATAYTVELSRINDEGLRAATTVTVAGNAWRSEVLSEGEYAWRVTARDGAGHSSAPSESRSFQRQAAVVAAREPEQKPEEKPVEPPPQTTPLPPFFSLAARVGLLVNGQAVLSPQPQLAFTARLPVLQRQLGLELRAGYYFAVRSSEVVQGKVVGRADLLPMSLLLAWHQPLGQFQLKGGVGPALQLAWVSVNGQHEFRALPGFEVALGVSYRLGPGRIEGDLGFLYSRFSSSLAALNASGFGARLGYAFDF